MLDDDECLMIMIHERERKKAAAARAGNDGGSHGNRPARRTGMRFQQSLSLEKKEKTMQKRKKKCGVRSYLDETESEYF
jgi:hypothetical protein